MEFFASQRISQRNSRGLIIAFVLAMLGISLLIHIVVTVMLSLINVHYALFDLSNPGLWLIGLFCLCCLSGCCFRYLDAKAGGEALAIRFGAVPLDYANANSTEKKLLRTIAEMAVASSCEMPAVYLMENDSNVNAFVVGSRKNQLTMVVSHAAMDVLNSDQITALIAHEFSHIANNDTQVNMRLMIVLAGLNTVDELGKKLLTRRYSSGSNTSFLIVPGLLLRLFGSSGVLLGKIIRAAFLRQRELLADASAVQYTRNAAAMASLLAYIKDQQVTRPVRSIYEEEFSHFCFQVGDRTGWLAKRLSSHPPLQTRLDAVDPHYEIKSRAKNNSIEESRKTREKPLGLRHANRIIAREKNLGSQSDFSAEELNDQIRLRLTGQQASLAMLHAVFVSADAQKKQRYFDAIAFAYNKLFAEEVCSLALEFEEQLKRDQLSLIEFACEQLCSSVQLENRKRFLKSLEKLLVAEDEFTVLNYATLQLIRRKLDADFPVLTLVKNEKNNSAKKASASQVKPLSSLGEEFALLLSLIIESAGSPTEKQTAEFNRVLKCYTDETLPRRSKHEPGIIDDLERAFQSLYVQPLAARNAFVQHCVEIAQSDGYLARAEEALLELFAASLNCEAA